MSKIRIGIVGYGNIGRGVEPVSYTHLDVYKRQVYKNIIFLLHPWHEPCRD